tara:strand:+ start:328 stop:480 length:153 start_codon:yes stop_codon:yes gene_type:complete
MSFKPDNLDSENAIECLLEKQLIELKKIVLILSDIHDVQIDDEDVDNECD